MERLRSRFRALLIAALILVVSIPAMAQSPEVPGQHDEVPEGTTEDAFNIQAEYYAALVGVDIDEAKRRLELQGLVGNLVRQLDQHARDVLGGVRIEHEPEFNIVVSVVPGGEERVRPYVIEGPLRDITVIETVERTEDELLAELERTISILEALDLTYQAELWEQREVRITVEDMEAFAQRIDEAGVRLATSVVVVEDPDGMDRPAAHVLGGFAITGCTSGFAGRYQDSSTYIKGVLTAGHCGGLNGSTVQFAHIPGANFNYYSEYVGGPRDVQLNRHNTNHTLRSMINIGTTWVPITGLRWKSIDMPIGTFVCKFGKTTQYTCGWIRGHNVKLADFQGRTFTATFTRLSNTNGPFDPNGNTIILAGDSGGPVHGAISAVYNSAYGIVTSYSEGGKQGTFMAQDHLYEVGYRIFVNCPTVGGIDYTC